MFFRRRLVNDSYNVIAENIKKDLVATLQRKGINIAKVQINMQSGNLNLEVLINEK